MHYSILLKEIREERGLSYQAMAKKVGVSRIYLSQLEKNRTSKGQIIRITLDMAHKICTGIDYSFRTFLVKTGYINLSEVNALCDRLPEVNRDKLVSFGKTLLATRTHGSVQAAPERSIIRYGELIRKIRTEKGVSLHWLESKVGISHSYLSQVENNRSTHNNNIHITLDAMHSVCEGLRYPFDKFLEESGYLDYNDRSEIDTIYDQLPECDKSRLVSYAKYLLGEGDAPAGGN